MADLLSEASSAEARRLGWQVVEVYDLKTNKLVPALLPAAAMESWDSTALMNFVTRCARGNNSAAIETLSALVRRRPKGKK